MERLPYIDEHATTIDADRAETWAALLAMNVPPAFEIDETVAPERLVLSGHHPFSQYELVFLLDDAGPGRTTLRAQSWAAFPGLHGKIYRALVIGTGLHVIAVRLMLRRIAAAVPSAAAVTE